MPKKRIVKFFDELDKLSFTTEKAILKHSDSFMIVVLCISKLERAFTAKEVHLLVKDTGKNTSLQHIYRILKTLLSAGLIQKKFEIKHAYIKI